MEQNKWYFELPGSVELVVPSADFKKGERSCLNLSVTFMERI